MSVYQTIPAVNGVYEINVGSLTGQIEVRIVSRSAPAAGTVRIQGHAWSGGTVQFAGASARALTGLAAGAIAASEFGYFQSITLTLSGVSGGTDPLEVVIAQVAAAGPPDAYAGLRALVTQSYVETNTKLGTQFYLRTAATVAPGASWFLGFQTGAQTVLVKARDCYAAAESLALTIYKGSTYTGGTPIVVQNYNDVAPAATTVIAANGVTPSANGTQWGGSEHIYGSNSVAQRTGAGLPAGGERVLAQNKAYMVGITNNGSASVNLDYFLTWFEGTPDLPRS